MTEHLPNFRGTINYDDEGTAAKRNVLIEKGVLKGFMTDVLSAKQLSMARTGNGQAGIIQIYPYPENDKYIH